MIAICLVGCSSCWFDLEDLNWNPQGDWDYELCHDYRIMRINSKTIELCVKGSISFSPVVDSYVTSFCYNENFIAVRRLDIGDRKIEEIDFEEAEYYLIDAVNGSVFGPFAEEEAFQAVCEQQKAGLLGEWIDTYPAPEGARF